MKTKKEYLKKLNKEQDKLRTRIPGYQDLGLTGEENFEQLTVLRERLTAHVMCQANRISWTGKLKRYDTVLNINKRMNIALLGLWELLYNENKAERKQT